MLLANFLLQIVDNLKNYNYDRTKNGLRVNSGTTPS